PAIEWLGGRSHDEVLQLMGQARAVIIPSIWYETFGRVTMEAFSKGTPVISSRIGALTELVGECQTGLAFEPGDATGLAQQVHHLWNHPELLSTMRANARAAFEERYTAEA